MFLKEHPESLGKNSYIFRYVYFMLSSFRFKSFAQWKAEGEPNPFVAKKLKRRQTSRQEIVEIFHDKL